MPTRGYATVEPKGDGEIATKTISTVSISSSISHKIYNLVMKKEDSLVII